MARTDVHSPPAVAPPAPGHLPRGPVETPFRALIHTFGALRRVMEPFFTNFGISGSHWAVLRALARAEDEGKSGLRLTDIGERLLIRPPSVTGVVDRLQRMGLLVRQPLADDHRARQVSLTPAGRERVQRVLGHLPAQVELVLGPLDPGERAELQRLLIKLGTHLEQTPAPTPFPDQA